MISVASRAAPGLSQAFGAVIEENLSARAESSASRLLGLANIRHVVVRTDMYGTELDMDDVLSQLRSDSKFRQVFESGPVVVFENLGALPRVYAASRSIAHDEGPSGIPEAIEADDYVHGTTVFLADDKREQSNGTPSVPGERSSRDEGRVIQFSQINPTKFEVRASANGPFWLVFGESFDRGWKAYVSPITSPPNGENRNDDPLTGTTSAAPGNRFTPRDVHYLAGDSLDEDLHALANGYANAWYIDPEDFGSSDVEITLFFQPQGFYYVGLAFSILSILGLVTFVAVRIRRARRRAQGSNPLMPALSASPTYTRV